MVSNVEYHGGKKKKKANQAKKSMELGTETFWKLTVCERVNSNCYYSVTTSGDDTNTADTQPSDVSLFLMILQRPLNFMSLNQI